MGEFLQTKYWQKNIIYFRLMPDERACGISQKCGNQFKKNSQYFTRRNLSRDLQCPQKMFAILAIFSNNSLAF
jgi:hypothetical protein